ncbi:Inner spore coat protein H [Rubripirellula tenax]|uniref:Inner spore coat protein H n=1 Tax=Rubripirellula tenax TaxID=2528015 RepID=A0A5C6FFC3_9BACT|nr:lamin tail domain-containing protein [Rubripirellula tenax]TWU59230.1 Inner spore coat protein H [Rubripirellula tenax]
MPKPQDFLSRAFSRLSGSRDRKTTRRRRPSRRLSAEALEARQLLAGDLFINEIMASNTTTIEDPDEAGAFEDWVEIYNAGTTAVDLGGMYLTDDVDAPTQWQFPTGSTIAAGGFLLIWADSEPEQGDNHASFKLSASGETVALYDTDGTTLVDSIEFGEQVTDIAFGRSPDGSETLSVLTTPTPGAANSVVGEANLAPTANAGGPYFGTTADTISLSAASSSDSDGSIATYAWDLDHDGEYDDATGESVSFSSTTVGTFVVGLQVTDDDGATSVDTGTIKISQVGEVASPWEAVTIDDEAAAFFDDTYVHELSITFEDDDWYNTLFTSHDTDAADPYFQANFVADGVALDNVGVRFKGNSSFSGSGVKKSIKIDFNEYEDLTFMGMKKLNLNNNFNDPTMLREKLFYDYASNFVEGVGRAVFTRVTINGEFYGLYTAVEQVDSTFTQSRFGDDEDGNLYKGTASDDAVLSDPQADFGSDLTYLGTDQAAYEAFYELKTNEAANDYSQLIEMIDVLNNTPSAELADAIEPLLDVQDTLASLALNNLFVNLDSYSGAAHNYYLYDRDDTGQFTHLLWDANESFGTFTQFVDRGTNVVQLDPFFLPVGTGGRPGQPVEEELRPLAENLWAVDEYSTDYLRDLQQMLEQGFDVTSATARINKLADLIRADVSEDPNKQFTTAQFELNLTNNVTAGNRTLYGLTSFIGNRSSYLTSALSQYDLEPESVGVYINEIMADNDATIEDPDEAGAFEDWIELYNPGTTPVDLSGLYLTDDATDPTQWEFPRGSTIDAGGYLIIWADGDTDQGDNHASFKLSAGGESVLLYNNDGSTLVDSITFGQQTTDVSYGRFPDGSSTLNVLSAATPGASNTNDTTPNNVAPTAEAGGPYTGTVGGTINLSGATSTDSDGTIASYAWDLDNDGLYDDAITATATFNAAATGTFTVGLQVTDDDGATSTDTATVTVNIESAAIFINEIMADNDATIEDPDEAGAFEDWIELYNPGTTSVDLSGFYLTDDAADSTQWQFPAGSTIDAGGYLIIWADDEIDQGDNHASFKLSAGGESVLLYNVDGTTLVDSVTFGEQTTDISYGRFPDGSSTLTVLSAASPGATNTNEVIENIAPTAEAGGPYTGTVGEMITLSGATSTDPDGTITSYAWDLDNDGQYDDATGVTAMFTATATGTFTVGLQVTDDDGATNANTASVTVTADASVIFINEIMADNDTTIEDPDETGAFEDWIELFNSGTDSVDLSGYYLTDDAADATQWQFPVGSTIAAGGYLIIWADGDTDQGNSHASFKLSAGGESVLLYNVDGTTLVDSVTFGEQTTDISYGRFPDGSATLTVLSAATPGATNTNDVIANIAPTAEAGGPYSGTVGDTITLSGATSTDTDGTIETYAWDLDNDGLYDDATGVTASYSAAAAGTFTVGLQVTDDAGATSTDTATIAVGVATTPGLVLTQTNGSTIVSESGLTDTISVSLSSQPAASVTVGIVSKDTGEVTVSISQLTFTPENWSVPQEITLSAADDQLDDGSQSTTVTFSITSTDADYGALANVDVDVTTHDVSTSNSPTRIYTPDFVTRIHVIPGDSIPTAILFQAVADAEISVIPINTASVGQTIRIVDQSVSQVDFFAEGVTRATITAGGLYAIIFESHEESRSYTVQSTAGTDAFIPSAPTNFLQSTDTNGDSRTTAIDALVIINQLSRLETAESEELPSALMYDVNHDGNTTALDALLVINQLSHQSLAPSEGEFVPSVVQQILPLSNSLTTTIADDECDSIALDDESLSADSTTLSEMTSFQSRSSAVAQLVEEGESAVSEDDLDLLASDLQQTLGLRQLLASQRS